MNFKNQEDGYTGYAKEKKLRPWARIFLSVLFVGICGCNKIEGASTKVEIGVGDGVTLLKDSYACKKPISELDTVVTNGATLSNDIVIKIKANPDCHDTNKFLVNSEWMVLKIEGNKLLVKMPGYVGEYWTSKESVKFSSHGKGRAPAVDTLPPTVVRTNFNPKTEKLEVNFSGDDPWEVLSAIKLLNVYKGTYENTQDYNVRVAQFTNSKLFENVKFNGSFIFKVNAPIGVGYNADLKEMSYTAYGDFNIAERNFDSKNWKKFYLSEHHKIVNEVEQIIVENSKNKKEGYYSYSGKVKISPDVAKGISGKVSFYVVGKFVKPFYHTDLKLPLEYNESTVKFQTQFSFSVEEILMVNEKTGEILTRKFSIKKLA